MNKFTYGMISGMSALALAVPALAQISSAQSGEDVIFTKAVDMKEIAFTTPSQECLEAMAALEEAHLSNLDVQIAMQKENIQTRIISLREAAGIADEDARKKALEQMREDVRANFDGEDIPEAVKTAMENLKEACGDTPFMMHFGPMHMGMGGMGEASFTMARPFPGKLAEQLGMTEEELKAALEDGTTIEELAEEKGVELPVRIERFKINLSEDLGLTEEELQEQLASGKSIKEIAEEQGVELPAFGGKHTPGIRMFQWDTESTSSEITED